MATRRDQVLGALSLLCAACCATLTLAQPGACGCGTGTPCASTKCVRSCYTCCNNNCTDKVCCQDWCDGRALPCHEDPPDGEGEPGSPGN